MSFNRYPPLLNQVYDAQLMPQRQRWDLGGVCCVDNARGAEAQALVSRLLFQGKSSETAMHGGHASSQEG
jgi:hypothetical protein